MSVIVSLEQIEPNLKQLVERLPLGETITLVKASGAPIAIVVSLLPPTPNEFSGNQLAEALFKQRALEAGLIRATPTPLTPLVKRERSLIEVEGTPLSQTIVEERR